MAIDWEGLLGCSTHLQEAYDDLVMDALEKETQNDFYQDQFPSQCVHEKQPSSTSEKAGLTQAPLDYSTSCPFHSFSCDACDQQEKCCAHTDSSQGFCPNCPCSRYTDDSDDGLPF